MRYADGWAWMYLYPHQTAGYLYVVCDMLYKWLVHSYQMISLVNIRAKNWKISCYRYTCGSNLSMIRFIRILMLLQMSTSVYAHGARDFSLNLGVYQCEYSYSIWNSCLLGFRLQRFIICESLDVSNHYLPFHDEHHLPRRTYLSL